MDPQHLETNNLNTSEHQRSVTLVSRYKIEKLSLHKFRLYIQGHEVQRRKHQNTCKYNKGKWTSEEKARYAEFVNRNKMLEDSETHRKEKNYFNFMSIFIRTRDPAQCKSHDQKINKKMFKPRVNGIRSKSNPQHLSQKITHHAHSIPKSVNNIRINLKNEHYIESEASLLDPYKDGFDYSDTKKCEPIVIEAVKEEYSWPEQSYSSQKTKINMNSDAKQLHIEPKIEIKLENEPYIEQEDILSATIKNEFDDPSETMKCEPIMTEAVIHEKIEDFATTGQSSYPIDLKQVHSQNSQSTKSEQLFFNHPLENCFMSADPDQKIIKGMDHDQNGEIITTSENILRYQYAQQAYFQMMNWGMVYLSNICSITKKSDK